MQEEQDFPLPSLAPHLKLSRGPDEGGEPSYTLHNPAANTYFKIDWIAFECISRIPQYKTSILLKNAIEAETTLKITIEQIQDIVTFLSKNALLSLKDQKILFQTGQRIPFWKKILHQYLYFSIPLFKPQKFLEKTYPRIAWLYSGVFLKSCMVFLAIMLLATLPRLDEFLHTFSNLFSAQGVISTLLVFAFVKIVHEFAHAYTAIRYGVKVPHMGVAVMLMYPVLYTETTGSWALSSRRARFHIGMAGICAELCLAAFFLLIWHISPSGSLAQTLSFLVVSISLISSLLINLNPFMRFDGYYMFSDATGFDNLQNRSCSFARHALRKALFGWDDPAPENISIEKQKFLSAFGFGLLTFRFFLFLGIAILVYHLFFQPLGFILMMVELTWFIALPIWSEVKIWKQNKARIFSSRRSLIPAGVVLLLFLGFIIPWKTSVVLPAVVHAGSQQTFYPPYPSQIISLHVHEGKSVNEGDILAELDSPELDYNIKIATQELDRLETLKRRGHSIVQTLHNNELSDASIEKARIKLESYKLEKTRLKITAPFSGIVRDLGVEITQSRFVGATEALFTLVDPETTMVSAYATEDEREQISGKQAIFTSEFKIIKIKSLEVTRTADTGNTDIPWPELASTHGGPIPSDIDENGTLMGRRALYEIIAKSSNGAPEQAMRGYLKISTSPISLFSILINRLVSTLRFEGKV